jgi:hypothetical protein
MKLTKDSIAIQKTEEVSLAKMTQQYRQGRIKIILKKTQLRKMKDNRKHS